MILIALVAPAIGILVDFAFKPTKLGAALLALAAGGAAWWAFGPVLAQRPASEAGLLLASAIVVAAFVVGFGQAALAADGVRAGAAALALGIGAAWRRSSLPRSPTARTAWRSARAPAPSSCRR